MSLRREAKEMRVALVGLSFFWTGTITDRYWTKEFNILYRWHAAVSDGDAKWIDQELTDMFHKPAADVSNSFLLIA